MPYRHHRFVVGLDLGQKRDFTALAVLRLPADRTAEGERNQTRTGGYEVPYLHRYPLGTPYNAIVDHVVDLMNRRPLFERALLVADATGVGAPVIDMLCPHLPRHLYGATITSGDQATYDGMSIRVPKRDLVTTLTLLLESDRLRVAKDLPNASTLVDELLAFRVRVSARGHDSYGTPDWREREHDDLVLAVALAAWVGEKPPRIARVVPD